jgi:hypothetical protein
MHVGVDLSVVYLRLSVVLVVTTASAFISIANPSPSTVAGDGEPDSVRHPCLDGSEDLRALCLVSWCRLVLHPGFVMWTVADVLVRRWAAPTGRRSGA